MKTKEELAEYMHRYYLSHRSHLLRQHKAWYRKNADRVNYERRVRYCTDPEFRKWDIERHRKHNKHTEDTDNGE